MVSGRFWLTMMTETASWEVPSITGQRRKEIPEKLSAQFDFKRQSIIAGRCLGEIDVMHIKIIIASLALSCAHHKQGGEKMFKRP